MNMTEKGNRYACGEGEITGAKDYDGKRRETMNFNENETEEVYTEEEMLAYTE